MKYRIKDIINPIKWVSILQSLILSKKLHAPHIIVQYAMRFQEPLCQVCFKAGECIQSVGGQKPCRCALPGKALVPWESCSCGHWGPIIQDKEKWEKHVEHYNIKFIPKYNSNE